MYSDACRGHAYVLCSLTTWAAKCMLSIPTLRDRLMSDRITWTLECLCICWRSFGYLYIYIYYDKVSLCIDAKLYPIIYCIGRVDFYNMLHFW